MYVVWNLSRYSSVLFYSVRQYNPLFANIPHWKAIFWVWVMNHFLHVLQQIGDFFYCCSSRYIWNICISLKWDSTRKPVFGVCEQQRRRSSCASAQSDQRLCYSLSGEHRSQACSLQNFIFLPSLCSRGDWFESRFVGTFSLVEVLIIADIFCITLYCHDSCVSINKWHIKILIILNSY